MLLVWLLALAAGVANACLSGGAMPSSVPAHAASWAVDDAAPALPDIPGCMDHQPEGANSACQKFCDDGSAGVTVLKAVASPQDACALAIWPTLALALQATCDLSGLPSAAPMHPPAAVPVPIAFLRLTL